MRVWVLVIALAVMTGLFLQAVAQLEGQKARTQRISSLQNQCAVLYEEAERYLHGVEPPLLGWEEFDRERVS